VRHKCNRCGKPQSRPLDLFTRNPNLAQAETFIPNNFNQSDTPDLLNQNNLNQIKTQALNFNSLQNNKQIVSPQNKFKSMRSMPINQGFEDITNSLNTPNINHYQQKQKFAFDNQTNNPQLSSHSKSQVYHAKSLNNMQQQNNENMFNNLSNYYNNNQGNENLSLIKTNFSKVSSSILNNMITNNKAEVFNSGLSNIVQPHVSAAGSTKETHISKPPQDSHIHGTFPYPRQGDCSQIRNNFAGFNSYSNTNNFGRDDYGNNQIYAMNANNLQQQQQNLNQNHNQMLNYNNQNNNLQNSLSNQINLKSSPSDKNLNNSNFALQQHPNNLNLINAINNQLENQGCGLMNNNYAAMNNRNQGNLSGNIGNNRLSLLGNNLLQNSQNINQQQTQFNLQNNLNNYNNMAGNQLPIANKLAGFSNINFSNDFKKKYTPLDNLRLQNPTLNLLNSPQMNVSLGGLNKDNIANSQNNNVNLKGKVIGVNNLFDIHLEENFRNFSMQNAQNNLLNKAAFDKKTTTEIEKIENTSGSASASNNQLINTPKTNTPTTKEKSSSEIKLNKLNSPINQDIISSDINTTIAQSSENYGRLSSLNIDSDSLSNADNLNNLSRMTNLANMNLKTSNNNNLNNFSMQQQNAENLANLDNKKKKKPFVERVGDWVCIKCKNLNFSFRVVCNRCQLTKAESDKLFEQYMKNLMNYVKINEIIQNQIMNYPHLNTNFINQISNMDLNSQQEGGLSEFLHKNNIGLDANGNLVNNSDSNTDNAEISPQQPEGFGINKNRDLNNISENNLNFNNEMENAQQQSYTSSLENSNLNYKNNLDYSNIENNKNLDINSKTSSIPNLCFNSNQNNSLENIGEKKINDNHLLINKNNNTSYYHSFDEIQSMIKSSKEEKQENNNLNISVNQSISNQSTKNNEDKNKISESKNNNNISFDSSSQANNSNNINNKLDKKEEAQKNQSEIIFTENKTEKPISVVNTSRSDYQSNPESYNNSAYAYDDYDSSYNNNSSKGSYYNSYYNQKKNYRNDYNSSSTTSRNYRNPNSKNINTNRNINLDKRSNQYYKNSGFSSDVQNK